ncbi:MULTISPECIES: hypothetical protein [unclassified Fibrobacter]|uniref:hypothetical protein n=1 Tax=unclassified Fibrobacter TaxID=2634177 RepID=UPI000911746F|nr:MULTISPECIES: hypothetical protein [Fibrobacter]MCL4103431.1 hypothetical protein [Fibrobacter succinogenes]MCQ2100539.1 hypothetical protein [Fibrobacter sp.]MDO4948537.1 hypothetical protein [Fibrobacter sp.]SHK44711.1 hypothetical protein SAMN05720765_102255 [Fibrobacter sp. UWH6]
MKIKALLLAALSTLMLSGCALIKSNNTKVISPIEPVSNAAFEAYGNERIDVLGMAATKADGPCSAVEFFKFITKLYPDADDMINVHMEETEITKGSTKTYSCKYSGLAIAYTPLTLNESIAWKKSEQVEEKPLPVKTEIKEVPVPACTPCACVTCGCQPCSNINPNNYYKPEN